MESRFLAIVPLAFLSLCVCVFFGASAFGQDEYLVRLTEYDRPGDKSEITLDATQEMQMKITQGDQTILERAEVNKIRLVAILEVIRVDARSLLSEVRFTVKEAKLETEDGAIEFVKPESVLLVRNNGDETEFLDERSQQPIEAEASGLLQRVFTLPGSEPQSDEMFGTPAQGAVGAVWEADADRLVKMYKSHGLDFDAKNVSGKATLRAATEEAGEKILVVDVALEAKTENPPNAPPGFDPVLANVSVEHTLHIPADYSTGRRFERFSKTMQGEFRGKAGSFRQGQVAVFRSEEVNNARVKWLNYEPRSTERPD